MMEDLLRYIALLLLIFGTEIVAEDPEEVFEPLDNFPSAYSYSVLLEANLGKLSAGPARPRIAPVHDLPNVDFVIVAFHPGMKNPKQFLTNHYEQTWGKEGAEQLKKIGVEQALFLGKAIRERYSRLLPGTYRMKNFRAYSSGSYPEQMTMQAFTAGLFQSSGIADWKPFLEFQPVPIETENTILGLVMVDECITARKALKPIISDKLPELRDWLRRESYVVSYISETTGMAGTLERLAVVADNLFEMKRSNISFPVWAQHPQLRGHNRESLYSKIQEFKDVHEISCSKYRICRQMIGGVLINDMLEHIKTKQKKDGGLKMVAYSGDLMTLLSAMRLLNFDYLEIPDNAGIIIEFRKFPIPAVRFLFHAPDHRSPEFRKIFIARMSPRLQSACPGDWCPLEYYLAEVERYAISDYRSACKISDKCKFEEPKTTTTTKSPMYVTTAEPSLNCRVEENQSPTDSCYEWAKHGYCNSVPSVRFLFCRYTCLCSSLGRP